MKFVNIEFDTSADNTVALLSDNEAVNKNVKFDEKRGRPFMKVKRKNGGKLKITCEMMGRPTKDNGFLVGTYFSGRLTEKNGKTRLKGIILTAPIYHLILAALVAVFVVQCFRMSAFSPIPPIIVVFDIFMFKDEFRKQGYIYRYLYRARRKTEENR